MKRHVIGLSLVLIAGVSCGKKKEEDKKATVKLNILPSTLNLATMGGSANLLASPFVDLPISTAATSDGLFSLKMYFREIKICKSLEVSGSGYSNPAGCATIYLNESDAYTGMQAPTAADRTLFTAADEGKYYNVLSSTDLAKLTKDVKVDAGEYNYGIIEMHPWVKIIAKSGTICTKATGVKEASATGGDGVVSYKTQVDSLDCGSTGAEEVLTYITNANSNFKFLKPFTVAENDSVELDLAFNLDKTVRAIVGDSSSNSGNLTSATGNNSFYVPMFKLGPAPRKAAEKTQIETYTLGTTSQKDQIRVELYYNSADTTKSIQAVNATVLGTASSTKSKANASIYTYKIEQTGDVVTLKSWDNATVMSFTRGAAGTATIDCNGTGGAVNSLEECSGQTTLSLSYDAPTVTQLSK